MNKVHMSSLLFAWLLSAALMGCGDAAVQDEDQLVQTIATMEEQIKKHEANGIDASEVKRLKGELEEQLSLLRKEKY